MTDKGRKTVEKQARALERLTVEYVRVDSIKPNSYNPNRQDPHEFELLCRSIREDGFTQPVVCQKEGRVIVDGEHRWRAAQTIGMTEIPVCFVDMTEQQRRIATLRHNRARGSEDIELSAQVLRDLQKLGALDHAKDSLMLDDVEINKLINDVAAPEGLAGAEFTTAWAPGEAGEDTTGGSRDVATTAAAADAVRENEKKVAAAKTDEERAQVRKDANVYRLTLVFAGEEADVVKDALGAKPAETVLAMCRAKQ